MPAGPYFVEPELLLPLVELPDVPGMLPLSVPVPVAPDDVPPLEAPEVSPLEDPEVPPVEAPEVSLELVPPVDAPDVPPALPSGAAPGVDAPPDVAPGAVLLAPPVLLDGDDGVAPGVGDGSAGGGVVAVGAEELGEVLLVPPVVPAPGSPPPPPPRLQAAMLRVSRPNRIRVREACNFGFIAIPFY